jgi:hypothetical protein
MPRSSNERFMDHTSNIHSQRVWEAQNRKEPSSRPVKLEKALLDCVPDVTADLFLTQQRPAEKKIAWNLSNSRPLVNGPPLDSYLFLTILNVPVE